MQQQITQIVNSMSDLIGQELHSISTEYWTPRHSPDQSESEMNFRKARIVRLRELRAEFENLMYGLGRETV